MPILFATLLLAQPDAAVGDVEDQTYVLDLAVLLRFTGTRADPQTTLTTTPLGFFDTSALLQPRPAEGYPSAVVFFGVEAQLKRWLAIRLLLDTGEIRPGSSLDPPLTRVSLAVDGEPFGSSLFSIDRLRELAFQFSFRRGSFEVGRRYAMIGGSLIYEDFGTGAGGSIEIGDWVLGAEAIIVGHSWDELTTPSPLLSLRIDHQLSIFESVGIFGALFIENGSILHDVLASSISEGFIATLGPVLEQVYLGDLFLAQRQTSGHLGYAGFDLQLLPAEGLSVRGAAALSFGSVTVDERAVTFDLSSWAANVEASYGITTNIGVAAFGIAMSGDRPPLAISGGGIDYHAFIGLAPYWTWTGLFFSGGLNQGFYPGRATAAGVNGHGVFAGGARFELSTDSALLELRLAAMWAHAAPPPSIGGTGKFYGVEGDLVFEWDILDWLGVGVELDLMRPGNFFPRHDWAFRAIGQIHARAGN